MLAEIKSRKKIIVAIILLVTIFLLFSKSCASYEGSTYIFRFFAVPVMEPCFADLRTITGGAESKKQGFDPMVKNPEDPWNRVMNYPRIWQYLYFFGINETHTIPMGILFVSLFLLGVCLILPNAPNEIILAVILALLSPAVLLGIERGNTDLLMFFLVALAVFLINRNRCYLSSFVILFAAFLKLFPIFAAVSLLRAEKKPFFRLFCIVCAVFAVYLAVTFSDLILISKGTPKSAYFSFGKDVLWMKAFEINESLGMFFKYFSYFVLAICAVSAIFLFFKKSIPIRFEESITLDSFRAGAMIYIGTFLLGSNFIYRLMFLIFVIPQLAIWIESLHGKYKILSFLTSLSVVWLLYESLIAKIFRQISPFIRLVRFINYHIIFIDEFFAWILFVSLQFFLWSDIGTRVGKNRKIDSASGK